MRGLGQVLLRPAVMAVIACGAIAACVPVVGATAQVRLASNIGGLARGAFDILVQPAAASNSALARTDGLIEPDYLSFQGKGGISFSQLNKIRKIAGVQVAAPISVVGQVTGSWATPNIIVPPSTQSRVYRFTLTQQVTDGVGSRTVSTQSFTAVLPASGAAQAASDGGGSFVGQDQQGNWTVVSQALPPVTSSVVAVDPEAEQELLGHKVTALTQLAELRSRTTQPFTVATLNEAMATATAKKQLTSTQGIMFGLPKSSQVPLVPVIVTPSDPSSGTLKLSASLLAEGPSVDQAITKDGDSSQEMLSQFRAPTAPLSVSTATKTLDLAPLGSSDLSIGVDGDQADPGASGGTVTQVAGVRIDRPEYTAETSSNGSAAYRIAPHGAVSATGPTINLTPQTSTDLGQVSVTGQEQSYRKTQSVTAENEAALQPVRTFDPGDLVPDSPDQGRVSMGIYDVPAMTVATSDVAKSGTVLKPTLDPAGLVVRSPVAIADIRDASLLRGNTPIDAIRVRVSGIRTVNAATEQRVKDVAAQIASMGLNVDVVTGSSPQKVSIQVPDYITAAGKKTALGTVTQEWTTMGAATQVSHGLSSTTLWLVAVAAAGALAATVSGQFLEAETQRRDAAILSITGWSRRRIRRRFLAAPLIAGAAVIVVLAPVWWFTARNPIMGTIGLLLCLLAPAGAVAAAAGTTRGSVASRARAGDAVGRRHGAVKGRASLALRLNTSTPGRSLAAVTLVAVAAASVGVAVVTFTGRAAAAGPTLLAQSLVTTLETQQTLLLLVAIAASVGFAAALWRYSARSRLSTHSALRALGWQTHERRRFDLALLTWIALPGAVAGALIAAALVGFTGIAEAPSAGSTILAVVAALVAGCAVAAVMAAAARTSRIRKSTPAKEPR